MSLTKVKSLMPGPHGEGFRGKGARRMDRLGVRGEKLPQHPSVIAKKRAEQEVPGSRDSGLRPNVRMRSTGPGTTLLIFLPQQTRRRGSRVVSWEELSC